MATEKRLIDANAMREDWLTNGENEYVYDTNAILNSIDAQPTVDALVVVHGRWSGQYNAHCSNCGSFCTLAYIKDYPNYCPNCGAKMDL